MTTNAEDDQVEDHLIQQLLPMLIIHPFNIKISQPHLVISAVLVGKQVGTKQ